jgi:MarR family transcriptional regulator, lower aerobic nicotinate degradation pathway regulator
VTTSAAPSDLETHLGYWLRLVSNAVSQSFARKLEAEDITVAEWVFLRTLFDAEGVAPNRLAGLMGMTKGAISKLADRLVAKRLVERSANSEDGRTQSLSLTPAGREKVPLLASLADENDAAFFGRIEPDQRQALRRLMMTIAEKHELTGAPKD